MPTTPPSAARRSARSRRRPRQPVKQREGIAIVMALTAIAILALIVSEMHLSTSSSFRIAFAQRDRFQAEQLARSSLNLTRLLVSIEPEIRQIVTPIYQAVARRAPPQLPIWNFANSMLSPFCDYEGNLDALKTAGVATSQVEGLGKTGGTCQILAASENAKLNVNLQIGAAPEIAKRKIAQQLFSMMGGEISPNPYDKLFERRDRFGNTNTRMDIIAALIDWWDVDQQATMFDPRTGTVSQAGSEDDVYQRAGLGYRIKNAPYDSIEELRLIRGVDDDFWVNFVTNDDGDPSVRKLTIYGLGNINPNEAPPDVLLSRVCSLARESTLCADPLERLKFVQLVSTARMMLPLPFFTKGEDFVNFIQGKGGDTDLYPILQSFLGESSPMLFLPITLDAETIKQLTSSFNPETQIVSIDAMGYVGQSKVRLRTVVNFHSRWTPPPPNAGRVSPLGVLHYYRID